MVIGDTYDNLLGIRENNLKEADYLRYEIKSQRLFTSSDCLLPFTYHCFLNHQVIKPKQMDTCEKNMAK
jgi:hypothetical protein